MTVSYQEFFNHYQTLIINDYDYYKRKVVLKRIFNYFHKNIVGHFFLAIFSLMFLCFSPRLYLIIELSALFGAFLIFAGICELIIRKKSVKSDNKDITGEDKLESLEQE